MTALDAPPVNPAPRASAGPAPGAGWPAPSGPGAWLYECRVRHERFAPRAHRFVYRLFYLAIDLDEFAAPSRRLRLLGLNRAGLFSLRERDYLPLGEPVHRPEGAAAARLAGDDRVGPGSGLKARAEAFCEAHGVALGAGARVVLVTLPRVLGYAFNPVSFFFCFDRHGVPRAAIAEVTNTFREIKSYFVPVPVAVGASGRARFQVRVPKLFYVSPFSPVDAEFVFELRAPAEKLAVRIDDWEAGRCVVHATLTGERAALTDGRLAWFFIKYPLVTLGVFARIHAQALRLWLRRVPFFRKAAAADRQRNLHHPHASLATGHPP